MQGTRELTPNEIAFAEDAVMMMSVMDFRQSSVLIGNDHIKLWFTHESHPLTSPNVVCQRSLDGHRTMVVECPLRRGVKVTSMNIEYGSKDLPAILDYFEKIITAAKDINPYQKR